MQKESEIKNSDSFFIGHILVLVVKAVAAILVFGDTTEAIASALAVRNHWTVADTIGTDTTATRGTGHPGVAKWIVIWFSFVLFSVFSHYYRLQFGELATF